MQDVASPRGSIPRGDARRPRALVGASRDAGDFVELGLVEGLAGEEGFDDGVELVAVLLEELERAAIALVDEATDLFAESVERALGDAEHPRITLLGEDGDGAEPFGHAPAADHGARDAGADLEVVLGARGRSEEHTSELQ